MKDLLKFLVFGGIFLIPFLPVYVENDFFFPYITGKNFAFRIIVEVMVVAWGLLALLDKHYRPRFSWLIASFSALIIVMFFASVFSEHPHTSLWSNYERMDGYVTLVHVFLLTLVLGSVMTKEKLWTNFFLVSSGVAFLVALYGVAQMNGVIEGGRQRLDSRLGNAAYMAIYMLFHMAFVAWLAVRSKHRATWVIGTVVLAIYAYALILTGTRGTFLGLVGGAVVAVGYVALFGRKYPELRRYAIGGVFVLTVLVLGFMGIKDEAFVQNNGTLARYANIDIMQDLKTRGVIWSMAWEGVKERPILGWGQGSFNYVFNKNFDPVLYNKEAWFDRVHNIVLDWLIAGGALGFLAYASIFVAMLYYLLWRPYVHNDHHIDVLERAVIIGILAGYLIHNLVVFDNIISYIFFACLIALVHFRVSETVDAVEQFEIDERLVTQIIAPIALVFTLAIVYFVNVPGIQASGDIIDAMKTDNIRARLEQFHEALSRGSFGYQEIVEQLAQQAMNVARNPNLPAEDKELLLQRAELELLRLAEEKPGDARIHNFLATFYRTTGALPQAREQGAIARRLAPNKQSIILEQGVTELQLGETEKARDFFKAAYELETSNVQALIFYAASEVQLGNVEHAKELVGEEYLDEFASNDFALNSVNQVGEKEFLARLFEERVELFPNVAQNWASLGFIYYELGETDKAVHALRRGGEAVPSFASQATCFSANIEAGNEPNAGCSGTKTGSQ